MMLLQALENYIDAKAGTGRTQAPIDRFMLGKDGTCQGVQLEAGMKKSTPAKWWLLALGSKCLCVIASTPKNCRLRLLQPAKIFPMARCRLHGRIMCSMNCPTIAMAMT